MKDEAVNDPRNDATDEQRLMALLALTAQELPDAPPAAAVVAATAEQSNEAYFQRLDADPAALETYLRKGMRKPNSIAAQSSLQRMLQSLSAWLAPPQVRYAAAFGVMLIAGVLTMWNWSGHSMLDDVERSYSNVVLAANETLLLPWEQRSPVQGFTPTTGNDSPAGHSFAQGLVRARAKLTGRADDMRSLRAVAELENYVALGEWNALVWTAAQSTSEQGANFWGAQASLARKLRAALRDTDNVQAISVHMTIVEPLLDEMARAPNPRTARQLAAELARFREAFAPHAPPDPN
jgi:hypothetical protein